MAGKKVQRYKPHPLLADEQAIVDKISETTGKTVEAWVKLARAKGPKKRKDLQDWLKKEHAHTPMHAMWIAHFALTEDISYDDPEALVDALYSADKAALRPLHEAVVDVLIGLGEDVTVTSCKTMVPAYRKHVFAELAPVSGGVRLRMALGDIPLAGRLATAKGKMPGDRLTHEVIVRSKKDVNGELKTWLKKAYELGLGKIARDTSFELPADMAEGIAATKTGEATWESMTPAMQRDMVAWIQSAKVCEADRDPESPPRHGPREARVWKEACLLAAEVGRATPRERHLLGSPAT